MQPESNYRIVLLVLICLIFFEISMAVHDQTRKSSLHNYMQKKECHTSKRIILDLETSGLSNRIYALVSISMLAAVTNRVLEVTWHLDKGISVPFEEIFEAVRSDWGHSRAFLLNEQDRYGADSAYKSASQNLTSCRIDLSQHGNVMHLFFYDSGLFQKIDEQCQVIHIYRANAWFGQEILNLDKMFSGRDDQYALNLLLRLKKLKKAFPAPFHDMMKVIYRPKAKILRLEQELRDKFFDGRPYLSIHSRGFYDDGKGIELISRCARQLLDNGNVSFIFLATESSKIRDIARSIIPNESLVTINKEYIREGQDTYSLRKSTDAMTHAIEDWLIVGSADLCMAVTMAKSTFSQTSIVHGSCDYIPFDKKTYSKTPYDCVHLENNSGILKNRVHVYKGAEKEILVHGNDIEWNETIHYQRRIESTCGEQFKLPLTESHRALWWANITREILLVDVQCIREASLDFIDQYYFTSSDLDQKQQVNK